MTPAWRCTDGHTYRDQIPVAPLAAAVQLTIDEGWLPSYTELARRLWGGRSDCSKPDVTRLKRALGLSARTPSTSGPRRATLIRYSLAVDIATAAEIDPVDCGC